MEKAWKEFRKEREYVTVFLTEFVNLKYDWIMKVTVIYNPKLMWQLS